jgi:Putative restriction endonuclease
MARIKPTLTYEHLRHTPDDGKRYEILEGELVVTDSPTTAHQQIVGNLFEVLRQAQRAGRGRAYIGPVDVVLHDTEAVVVPDVVFIAKDRLAIVKEKAIIGAPILSWRFYLRAPGTATSYSSCGSTQSMASDGTRWLTPTVGKCAFSSGRMEPTKNTVFCGQARNCPASSSPV